MKNNLIKDVLSPILQNDKILIPEWAKRVKIDVGTSSNAPFSEFWINNDNELCVFGFEPNKYNIYNFTNGLSKNTNKININKINKSFFYINCALSNFISENENFYCTKVDGGTSSLFIPVTDKIEVEEVTIVPVITLESFFNYFPWDKIPFIDQIKIDAQSSDFNIIKGIGKYLTEKIIYIDVETTTEGQYSNDENPEDIKNFLENNGFECLKWGLDATFFNKKFIDIKHQINYNTLH
jgi:hypothetical protein